MEIDRYYKFNAFSPEIQLLNIYITALDYTLDLELLNQSLHTFKKDYVIKKTFQKGCHFLLYLNMCILYLCHFKMSNFL